MIKLQLKDSYPKDRLQVADLTILKSEPRAYSRPDDYLLKLASHVPCIMVVHSKESAPEKINEMVTSESTQSETFVEQESKPAKAKKTKKSKK